MFYGRYQVGYEKIRRWIHKRIVGDTKTQPRIASFPTVAMTRPVCAIDLTPLTGL